MQDRLEELRRQRALIADHLAWMDREIGALSASGANPATDPDGPAASPAGSPRPTVSGPIAPPKTDAAPAETPAAPTVPETNPGDIKDDVRRGCFLYFGLASLLVIIVGALLVWASQSYKKSHPPAPRVEQHGEP